MRRFWPLDGIGTVIGYSVLQVLSAEGGVEGRCRRSVGAAGEIATSGGSGVGGGMATGVSWS